MTPENKEAPELQPVVLRRLLGNGLTMIYINPQAEGVQLPAHLMEQKSCAITLSWRFAASVNLRLDLQGVRANLSFKGTNFPCVIPWRAIFAMGRVNEGPSAIWPDNIPEALKKILTPHAAAELGLGEKV